jgi:DNA-binding transcriptional regulator GbsR (MarR family)
MKLRSAEEKFILHWGEMGTRWGINRTVAQIHALLYLSPHPLNAEEASETLSIARSTVSTGLRELQSWGIVKVVHVMGDRRDHFETLGDVWQMFRRILDERKRRELDPTLQIIEESIAELDPNDETDAQTLEKLVQMQDFFQTIDALYNQIQNLPLDVILRILKTGDLISRILRLPDNEK